MKYLSLFTLFFLPLYLAALTEEEALAEQNLITTEIQAIRDQSSDPLTYCSAMKAWRLANQARIDEIDAALATAVRAPVMHSPHILQGCSAEETAFLTADYKLKRSFLDLREQCENLSASNHCVAFKAWRETNQAALDLVEAQAEALQGSGTISYPLLVLPEGLTQQEQDIYIENHALGAEIFNIRQQYGESAVLECCSAIKAWRMENQNRLDDLETLMQSL